MHQSGTNVVHYEMHKSAAAHEHPLISSQHQQDHYHCVPYEKTESQWTAVTDAATLHIAKDMEKTEVRPHAENFGPQVFMLLSWKYFPEVASAHLY